MKSKRRRRKVNRLWRRKPDPRATEAAAGSGAAQSATAPHGHRDTEPNVIPPMSDDAHKQPTINQTARPKKAATQSDGCNRPRTLFVGHLFKGTASGVDDHASLSRFNKQVQPHLNLDEVRFDCVGGLAVLRESVIGPSSVLDRTPSVGLFAHWISPVPIFTV